MEKITEHYGCLTKVEHLWCLEQFGIPNTCLLESLEIFPGYYGQVPAEAKPKFVYIVGAEKYSLENIMRFTKAVKNDCPHAFDGAFAEIAMRGDICTAVRITGISEYAFLKQVQETYKQKGMLLKKKVRKIENEEAVIKIRKFFRLRVISDDIFIDDSTPDIGYFRVEEDLKWDVFAKTIMLLRNNWSGKSFDAAKSFIYQQAEITDMVRIYAKGLSPELLQEIQLRYNSCLGK